jgi:hypothetical protein
MMPFRLTYSNFRSPTEAKQFLVAHAPQPGVERFQVQPGFSGVDYFCESPAVAMR